MTQKISETYSFGGADNKVNLLPFLSVLKNGDAVTIREVTAKDRHLLAIGYTPLSHQSRYPRFKAAQKNLTLAELDGFTVSNGPDHVAVGALLGEIPIGIARYVRLSDQDHSAEIELSIVESHQNLGLGDLMLDVLSQCAKVHGILEFIALVDRVNMPMLKLLAPLGGTQTMVGEAEIEAKFPVAEICASSYAFSVGDALGNAYKHTNNGQVGETGLFPAHRSEHWANLRLFTPISEKTSAFIAANQSISVWADDGGAIV